MFRILAGTLSLSQIFRCVAEDKRLDPVKLYSYIYPVACVSDIGRFSQVYVQLNRVGLFRRGRRTKAVKIRLNVFETEFIFFLWLALDCVY